MKKPNIKSYFLIMLLFFSTTALATGTKQRPPAKTNVEKSQQSLGGAISWFSQILIRD